MKKVLRVFFLLLALTLCVACKKEEPTPEPEKIEPFTLKEEFYKESKITDINLEELKKLIDDKESFIAYVYLPGCSSCAAFKTVLDAFQEEYTLSFYSVQIKYAKETVIGEKIKYAPSFVVFKEGKLVGYLDAESDKDKDSYESVDNFKKWLTQYINLK